MKSLFLLVLLLSTSVSAKVLMVSDIDDTIKRTHVLGYMTGGLRSTNPFIGLPELYTAFLCNQEVTKKEKDFCIKKKGVIHNNKRWITYVTAASGRLQMFGREFIARSNFPMAVVKGKNSEQDSYKFKSAEIASLLDGYPQYEIVLIGDNGQHDAGVYDHISKKFPFRKITSFIHQVYSSVEEDKEKRGSSLAKGQIAYLTATDLGLHFLKRNFIEEKDLANISRNVWKHLNTDDDDLYEQVIPSWTSCEEFVSSYKRADVKISVELSTLISKIEKRVEQLCLSKR
ncbi:phosphatase domain-containing protein [Halobacteriovorax sp. HLS]|uniref:phosphatase domain-containing protein n=1 Tax=Halobacteriovorax sp. HLS TaxID=2234000 RepID=UPI0013E2EAE4|nr:phosphatase domain-containing protein [Halobacteriovorax sp. HLS]